jgi:oligopeptide transport system permease protein
MTTTYDPILGLTQAQALPLVPESASDVSVSAPNQTWQARLRRRPAAMVSVAVLLLVTLIAFGASIIPAINPTAQNLTQINRWPGPAHWLGTDGFGRDLFARLLMGIRVSLTVAFFAGLIDLTVGVAWGLISGLSSPRVDNAMQRVLEVLGGIPTLVILVLMLTALPPGLLTIVLAMGITGWIPMARLVRSQGLRLKNQEFVLASRTLGASMTRIGLTHILPNSIGLIVVQAVFTIPTAIFFEAFLSFIGLGLRPPVASLGTLLSTGFATFQFLPFQMLAPAITLSVLMICFNLLADGLRDAFDSRVSK